MYSHIHPKPSTEQKQAEQKCNARKVLPCVIGTTSYGPWLALWGLRSDWLH